MSVWKSFSSKPLYPVSLSLSASNHRVERRLKGGVILAFAFGSFFLSGPGWANPAGSTYLDPVPEAQNLAGSDYLEAKQLLKNRKWPEAVIILRTLLRRHPDFASLGLDLARALVYSGRREEALSVIGQIIGRQRGQNREALIQRSRVLSRLFLTNGTFQLYQDGVNLLVDGKYRAARERFEKALETEPDNVEVLTRIGQCLVMDGDHDSAAERLKFARRLNPYDPGIRLWLGRAMHQRGELKDALVELETAFRALGDSEMAPVWMAEALVSANQRAQAVSLLESYVRTHPENMSALLTLAKFRLMAPGKESQNLWAARKDLQVLLSRLAVDNAVKPQALFSSNLNLNQQRPLSELQAETKKLIEHVDARIEEVNARKASQGR